MGPPLPPHPALWGPSSGSPSSPLSETTFAGVFWAEGGPGPVPHPFGSILGRSCSLILAFNTEPWRVITVPRFFVLP